MKQLGLMGMGIFSTLCVSCHDGNARSHTLPWGEGKTHVIDADGTVTTYTAPEGEDCLTLDQGSCVKPQDACEGDAELVLDHSGEVLEFVCYPDGDILSVGEIEASAGNVEQNQNDAVIVLDDLDDGVDLRGDLAVDANNVVIYGYGGDRSVIGGDVSVDGNNTIVRGVRIQGDVEIDKNNAVLLHVIIEGNLIIRGNGTLLTASDVLGKVEIRANNTQLSGNHFAGAVTDTGKNTRCTANRSAEDTNGDATLSSDELGLAVSCDP